MDDRDRGLAELLLGDGHGLLTAASLGLLTSGLFAWFLAATGQLLPHDVAWLSISEQELRSLYGGRVVDFMSHDRAAFGGTLVAISVMYLWLVREPLAAGHAWAWWTVVLSGGVGFLSFLTCLGTGYVDTWHALATLAILLPFATGLVLVRRQHPCTRAGWRAILRPGDCPRLRTRAGVGRAMLVLTGIGLVVTGLTILTIGSLVVFVPQDLGYLGADRSALESVDPKLVPLIAHDRAGFGGGLASGGLAILLSVWCAPGSRSLWQALALAGLAGFGAAIGTHLHIGYLDLAHVGPALAAAVVFAAGLLLSRVGRRMESR